MQSEKIYWTVFFRNVVFSASNLFGNKKTKVLGIGFDDWALRYIWQETFFSPGFSLRKSIFFSSDKILIFSDFYFSICSWFIPKRKKVVVWFMHGLRFQNKSMQNISPILTSRQICHLFVTHHDALLFFIANGIDSRKISILPLIPRPLEKVPEKKLNIANYFKENFTLIGNLQKDGNGSLRNVNASGPKLVKNPSLFIEALTLLGKSQPILVLLAGPCRSWTVGQLQDRGIPVLYFGIIPEHVKYEFLQLLDLYFFTSIDEGGPLGAVECLMMGGYAVSPAVGMMPDLERSNLPVRTFDDSQLGVEEIVVVLKQVISDRRAIKLKAEKRAPKAEKMLMNIRDKHRREANDVLVALRT